MTASVEPGYAGRRTRLAGPVTAPLFGPCTDARTEHRAGIKKNGFGQESASVAFRGDPCRGLVEVLRKEIGAPVATAEVEAPRVAITLEQAFVEPAVGFWSIGLLAKVVATIDLVWPDGTIEQRRFSGSYRSSELYVSDHDLQEATSRAFATWGQRVATAVISRLGKDGALDGSSP